MPKVKFEVSKYEDSLIEKIVNRAWTYYTSLKKTNPHTVVEMDKIDLTMDITACHCNGTPLELHRLLAANNSTFNHDVFGIVKHIDRSTGKIGENFVPRCAL